VIELIERSVREKEGETEEKGNEELSKNLRKVSTMTSRIAREIFETKER